MRRLLDYLVLPAEVSAFEARYLRRMNRIALVFMALHVPAMAVVAAVCGTGPLRAAAFTLAMLAGPALAYRTIERPRAVSVVFGVAAMGLGGLLVHFGQGPMQIEMHFYFFVLLALLVAFANPLVIVAAAATVAAHHLALFFLLPHSVFNYDASFWAVAVHAAFVALESVAACFVARSFFDNVIGLERAVEARTRELDARNRAMRLILDNVGQGFVSVDLRGEISPERSAALERWFGEPREGERVWDYLGRDNADERAWQRLAWEALDANDLPVEVALEQLPKALSRGTRSYKLDYQLIDGGGPSPRVLMVVTDATERLERDRLASEQREALQLFRRISQDRSGFEEFFGDGWSLVTRLLGGGLGRDQQLFHLHTLKGNCSLIGLEALASACHGLEEHLIESGGVLAADELRPLAKHWGAFSELAHKLLGARGRCAVELDEAEYQALRAAAAPGAPHEPLARLVESLRHEPAARRLERIAEQARDLARRVGKPEINVRVETGRLRLPSQAWAGFWAALVHALRNALAHGTESPEERAAVGKLDAGCLTLRAGLAAEPGLVELEVEDDGRGVDWALVRAKAAEAGLPCADQRDLHEALFHVGLSTKDTVDDQAGRGVGLGALRVACEALGGSVRLLSEPGRGTRVLIRLPLPNDPPRPARGAPPSNRPRAATAALV